MAEISDDQIAEVMTFNEQVVDLLIDSYRQFDARDRAEGDTSEQGALGGIGMLVDSATEHGPATYSTLLPMTVRRLVKEIDARLAALKVIEEYESHNLAADQVEHKARIREVEKERDELLAALREANDNRLQIVEQHQKLIDSLNIARADRRFAEERANEAARLSAQARDEAEALNKVIADLREQVEIVEGDRLANDAWAVNVIVEHDIANVIEHQTGDEFAAIAKYIRAVRKDNATLAEFGDRAVEAREHYYRLYEAAVERLQLAKDALVATGYFTASEVSDDVAPRIIEFASAKRVELEATQDDRDEARHALRECARELKAAQERLDSIREAGIEASEREP